MQSSILTKPSNFIYLLVIVPVLSKHIVFSIPASRVLAKYIFVIPCLLNLSNEKPNTILKKLPKKGGTTWINNKILNYSLFLRSYSRTVLKLAKKAMKTINAKAPWKTIEFL